MTLRPDPFTEIREALFVCGATLTYRADSRGWWKLDWLRRTFTRGGFNAR